ncbi:MAG: MmcQ/YjbR family DNA-binding protein [Clostridia bacterium]|nr:MmcQ/YjbR family DNA-binding protein [Clostridia bacterium]
MNKIVAQIYKNKKANFDKLIKYGFTLADNAYVLQRDMMDGQFSLRVKVTDTDIETEVLDLATNEPYTLFLVSEAVGSFVGAIRTEYQEIMLDIAERCFDDYIFKSEYTQSVINYVTDKYGDSLEFLWEKFTDNAVWRRKDNQKWYAAILTVKKDRLGFGSDEKIEVIDLRYNADKIDELVDNVKIFRGYHMNKKHWITICLDGSVELSEIYALIDNSYLLAKK